MKPTFRRPVYLSLGAGITCFALHLWVRSACLDWKKLWVESAFLPVLLFALCALCVGTFFVFLLREKKGSLCRMDKDPFFSFFASLVAAVGFASLGFFPALAQAGALHQAVRLLAFVSAGAMAVNAVLLQIKKKPSFVCCVPAVLLNMVYPLSRHSVWSFQTQFLDYGFPLLAAVSLLLFSYGWCHLSVFPYRCRYLLFWGLCTAFFNLIAAAAEQPIYHLCMAFFASAGLLSAISYTAPTPMELPENVELCLARLKKGGTPGYLVGGCVRDHLLGLRPHDYDLCTAATPEKLCELFSDCGLVRNGEKHGTIGVVFHKEVLEITTFRTEGDYEDGRHPNWVEFVPDLESDLARRDFTVNAIAYNPDKGFIDPFDGIIDLQDGVLRAVGDPSQRFQEDALRILRGVRFSVRFRLQVESATQQAMLACKENMGQLAQERVYSELCKLLPLLKAKDLLRFGDIFAYALPELAPGLGFGQHNPHHAYDVFTHTAFVVENTPGDLALRWAALLHDTGKPAVFTLDENGRGHFYDHAEKSAALADAALRRLKAPTALREEVVFLVKHHMVLWEQDEKLLRRRCSKYGITACKKLLALQRADFTSKGVAGHSVIDFDAIEEAIEIIERENACLHIADLAITGDDLLALGFEAGPKLGQCLAYLLEQVLDGAVPNEENALKAQAKACLEK